MISRASRRAPEIEWGNTMDELTRLARTLPAQRRAVTDDDAVQEAFIAVAAMDLTVLVNAPGYWYRIAARRRVDHQRAQTRADRHTTSLHAEAQDCEALDETDDLIDELDTLETQESGLKSGPSIATVLPRLSPGRRSLIEAELAGITDTATLASILGCTPSAVRVLRHRTYRQLRDLLDAP